MFVNTKTKPKLIIHKIFYLILKKKFLKKKKNFLNLSSLFLKTGVNFFQRNINNRRYGTIIKY